MRLPYLECGECEAEDERVQDEMERLRELLALVTEDTVDEQRLAEQEHLKIGGQVTKRQNI